MNLYARKEQRRNRLSVPTRTVMKPHLKKQLKDEAIESISQRFLAENVSKIQVIISADIMYLRQ